MPELARLDDIRKKRPLLHCISNTVTANDCANLALALGASPMMAEAPEEAAEIARLADAEVLNLGTPTRAKYEACLAAGGEAARLKKPIVLDPVGVGASYWRLEGAGRLLAAFRPCILRVNLSEARSLLGLAGREKGVDSAAEAAGAERAALAAELARACGCAVLLTGAEDLISDGARVAAVSGGSPLMPLVTGTAACSRCSAAPSPPWSRTPSRQRSWPPPSGRPAPSARSASPAGPGQAPCAPRSWTAHAPSRPETRPSQAASGRCENQYARPRRPRSPGAFCVRTFCTHAQFYKIFALSLTDL